MIRAVAIHVSTTAHVMYMVYIHVHVHVHANASEPVKSQWSCPHAIVG